MKHGKALAQLGATIVAIMLSGVPSIIGYLYLSDIYENVSYLAWLEYVVYIYAKCNWIIVVFGFITAIILSSFLCLAIDEYYD